MRTSFILTAIALSGLTWHPNAQARAGAAVSTGFRDPKSLNGLCTPDNAEQSYRKEGICLSLDEMFQKPCFKAKVEELRLRMLQDEKQAGFAKLKNKETFDTDLGCMSKDQKTGLYDIAEKDPDRFAHIIQQFVLTTGILESDLDVLNREKQGDPRGIMNLTQGKMDDPKYECGCNTGDVVSETQGPLDGHRSMICAAYMIVHEAAKDGVLYGNKMDDKGNKSPGGASKLFKSLQVPPDAKERTANQKFIDGKVDTYCQKYAGVGKVNPWDDSIRRSSDTTR